MKKLETAYIESFWGAIAAFLLLQIFGFVLFQAFIFLVFDAFSSRAAAFGMTSVLFWMVWGCFLSLPPVSLFFLN